MYALKISLYSKQSSDSILGSKIPAMVANAVLSCTGNNPQVSKKSTEELALVKEKPGKNEKSLRQILELFEGDILAILNNTDFSSILTSITEGCK